MMEETMEMVNTEEITIEDVENVSSGNGLRNSLIIGGAILAGWYTAKYLVSPLIAKIKNKKKQHTETKIVQIRSEEIEDVDSEE